MEQIVEYSTQPRYLHPMEARFHGSVISVELSVNTWMATRTFQIRGVLETDKYILFTLTLGT